jgi:hypothetical protein
MTMTAARRSRLVADSKFALTAALVLAPVSIALVLHGSRGIGPSAATRREVNAAITGIGPDRTRPPVADKALGPRRGACDRQHARKADRNCNPHRRSLRGLGEHDQNLWISDCDHRSRWSNVSFTHNAANALSEAARMIFLGSIKIDSLCELSRAQSRSQRRVILRARDAAAFSHSQDPKRTLNGIARRGIWHPVI